MQLNENGKIVAKELLRSAEIRKEIIIHEYIIMPNHLHAIIEIERAASIASDNTNQIQSTSNQNSTGDRPVAPTFASTFASTLTSNSIIALTTPDNISNSQNSTGDRPVAPTATFAPTQAPTFASTLTSNSIIALTTPDDISNSSNSIALIAVFRARKR